MSQSPKKHVPMPELQILEIRHEKSRKEIELEEFSRSFPLEIAYGEKKSKKPILN